MAKKNSLKLTMILLVALWCCSPAIAHRDTLIRMSTTGSLSGLPAEYKPASLKISRDASTNGASPRVVLSVGSWREELPACLGRLFDAPTEKLIKIFASWYHDPQRSGLPPYLAIHLPQRVSAPRQVDEYKLIFNLDDGAIIKLWSYTEVNDATTEVRDLPISSLCDKSKGNQVAPVPVGIIETLKPAGPAN